MLLCVPSTVEHCMVLCVPVTVEHCMVLCVPVTVEHCMVLCVPSTVEHCMVLCVSVTVQMLAGFSWHIQSSTFKCLSYVGLHPLYSICFLNMQFD